MTRLVCFRLSDEEYERLQQLCDASGARCASDVARYVVRQAIHSPVEPSNPHTIAELLRTLESVTEAILMTVQRLDGRASLDLTDAELSQLAGASK